MASNLTFLRCGTTNITVTNIPIVNGNLTDVTLAISQFNADYQCGIDFYQYTLKKNKRDYGSGIELETRDVQPNITETSFDCGLSALVIQLGNGTNFNDNEVYNCGIAYESNKLAKTSDSHMAKIPILLLSVSLLSFVLSSA